MAVETNKYDNPPVVEVVCEVAFGGSAWDGAVPGMFYDRFREQFPQKRELKLVGAHFTLGPEGASSAGLLPGQTRMQFVSGAGDRLIQLGQDLVVVNRLRPYTHFEDWEGDVHRAVEAYRDLAQPEALRSVSVRYLNRFDIPGSIVPLEEYVTIYPQIPTCFKNHGPFMVRFQMDVESKHQLLVTFASAPTEKVETSSFVLDLLDICSEVNFDSLPEQLKLAHEHLSSAFEESCTPALKKTFGPEEAE